MAKQGKAKAKKPVKKLQGCEKQTTKHYTKRDSPPYPATACCGLEKKGNDGNKYISKRASDGSCRWHPMKTRSQSQGGCE